jgi:hypothetical protein
VPVSEQVVLFCAVARLLVVADGRVTTEILESFGVKNFARSCVVGDFGVLK